MVHLAMLKILWWLCFARNVRSSVSVSERIVYQSMHDSNYYYYYYPMEWLA